ncbi:hypothetical protein A33Q_1499 [Indibacter alkaliphilus LW1]|jgi:hypothetical protein|uniref:Outer membrane protein beta-barrel domain-containing protein n=1 Tax=Indibacter alkaliphilus (strain CCUG 57479 / KCTC 22604 / LW1) TaxID=1189612 RepID=S2DFW0_INDAL|nr:hypothetical protein [Indibacter alkaliphilus]EOZ97992.1 hypothetical protein A33Q_1499 [Indibacter alkaliphilus LW1]
MKRQIFLLSILFLTFSSHAQERLSVGVQGGISKLISNTKESSNHLESFNAAGSIDANGGVFGRYYFAPNLAVRAGFGVMGMSTAREYLNTKYGRSNRGVNPSVNLSLDRLIPFGSGSWGLLASFGFQGTYLGQNAGEVIRNQSEEGYRLGAHLQTDSDGNVSSILGHDVVYATRQNSTLLHLRPEIGLYKQVGKNRFYTSFIYGIALGEDLYVKDYRSISLMGNFYSTKHRFSGDFALLQVGYEFLF